MTESINESRFSLRDYQKECLEAIYEGYRRGIRRALVSLPTGSGKTVIFSEFPRYFRMKKQMIVLAHRAELLDQAKDKIIRSNPGLKVEVEQADRIASPESDVIIASVPTLGRTDSKRLAALDPDRFFLIIVDEAHHSTAGTYKRILEYLGVFHPETRKLLVGFTATPKRGDGVGLNEVYQEIVYSKPLPDMINDGYLSPVAGYRVETDIDLTRVKTRMGDFVTSQLSSAVNIEARNNIITEVYSLYLKGKKTLCFCVDVAHALSVAGAFRSEGISAEAITGDMDMQRRGDILKGFSEGNIDVLANCMVLTEGYDEPSVEGIMLARPTKSSLLYTQMIGRGTRLHPGKENVTVIDIVDVTKGHSLSTLPSLFGLSPDFNLEGHTTDEARDAIRWVEANRPWVPVEKASSLTDLRYRCTKIDLFDLKTPDEVAYYSDFAWVSMGGGGYKISLSNGRRITIMPTILENYEVAFIEKGVERVIAEKKDLESAIFEAENYIKRDFSDLIPLLSLYSGWRNQPATEKQLAILSSRNLDVPKGITKGQASHLIGMLS
ncbi:MAG: DEAD/DEAH box helicase [Deltaproteobacteria bacterium]|nr:DEAD/DEAH box helicase [Deltaproteobacteria bacterium]